MLNKKEIKNLLKKGFDLELISFEFDVPIEKIKQCKAELEVTTQNDKTKTATCSKMEKIRERYKKQFYSNNKVETTKQKEILKQDDKYVDSVISKIEEETAKMQTLEINEKIKEASKIIKEVNALEEYDLTIEQYQKIYSLLNLEVLKKLNTKKDNKIDGIIYTNKQKIVRKMAQKVDYLQSQTEDIEELKKLKKVLRDKVTLKNQLSVGSVISKIENKILKIKQQEVKNKTKYNVPENIENIIKDIVNGTLETSIANEIINKEINKKLEKQNQTKFALTPEQVRIQIIEQIKTVLTERAEQYQIKNPKQAIEQLQEINGGQTQQALVTVIQNLVNTKKFEEAKAICSQKRDNQDAYFMKLLRKTVRNAQISDMVLKGINMQGTVEEENAYFELINKGLEAGNVRLNEITLGKSQDGLKNINLADIWIEEDTKEKN